MKSTLKIVVVVVVKYNNGIIIVYAILSSHYFFRYALFFFHKNVDFPTQAEYSYFLRFWAENILLFFFDY